MLRLIAMPRLSAMSQLSAILQERPRRRRCPEATSRLQLGVLLGVVLALAWPPAVARADQAASVAAQALFEQGQTLLEQGQFEAACEKFDASQRLEPGLGTLLYLGDCFERADKLASAWRTFKDASALAESRNDVERAEIARVRAVALEPRLTRLTVHVASDVPEGLEVRTNGLILDREQWGRDVPVDSGKWIVQVTAPGHVARQFEVLVLAGAKEPYQLHVPALMPMASAAETPTPAAVTSAEPLAPTPSLDTEQGVGAQQEVLAYVVGGVGVAAGVVSGVLSLLAVADKRASNEGHCDGNDCDAKGVRLRDRAVKRADVATVFGVVGGVGLVSGFTLYMTAPSSETVAAITWTTQW